MFPSMICAMVIMFTCAMTNLMQKDVLSSNAASMDGDEACDDAMCGCREQVHVCGEESKTACVRGRGGGGKRGALDYIPFLQLFPFLLFHYLIL